MTQGVKRPLGEVPRALALHHHEIEARPLHDPLEAFAQAMLPAGGLAEDCRAERSIGVRGADVVEVIDKLGMHRDHHDLPCLLLQEKDQAFDQVHVVPRHRHTITQPGTEVETQVDQRLPVQVWSGGDQQIDLFHREDFALRAGGFWQPHGRDRISVEIAEILGPLESGAQCLDIHNRRLRRAARVPSVIQEMLNHDRRDVPDGLGGGFAKVGEEKLHGVLVALERGRGVVPPDVVKVVVEVSLDTGRGQILTVDFLGDSVDHRLKLEGPRVARLGHALDVLQIRGHSGGSGLVRELG